MEFDKRRPIPKCSPASDGMSILKRLATQLSDAGWVFENTSE
jgi:hypothetical protein